MAFIEAVLILLLPLVAITVTQYMSLAQGAQYAFVSDALNFEKRESWSCFGLRYFLWHLVFVTLFCVKLSVFPESLRWLAWFNLFAYMFALWSGFKQIDDKAYFGSWRQYSHWVGSAVVFFLFAIETPAIWWPEKWFAIAYLIICSAYIVCFLIAERDKPPMLPDTGIPKIHQHLEVPVEYLILAVHLLVMSLNLSNVKQNASTGSTVSCCSADLEGAKAEFMELKLFEHVGPMANAWAVAGVCALLVATFACVAYAVLRHTWSQRQLKCQLLLGVEADTELHQQFKTVG